MCSLMILWLQEVLHSSTLQATLAYSLLLALAIGSAFAYRWLCLGRSLISEFYDVKERIRQLGKHRKPYTVLHLCERHQIHQIRGTHLRLQESRSLKELVDDVMAFANASDMPKLEAVLAALVEEGFQEPARVETMCRLGLPDCLRSTLSALIVQLSDEQIQKDSDAEGKALGAACLHASWLLVQFASGPPETRRALSRDISASQMAAFMRTLAPEELQAPAPSDRPVSMVFTPMSGGSSDLRASSSGQGNPDSSTGSNLRNPSAVLTAHNHTQQQWQQAQQQEQQKSKSCYVLRRQLPSALVDAVLRNCSWSLLLLCDVAWAPPASPQQLEDHTGSASAPEKMAGDVTVEEVKIAVEFSRTLLLPPPPAGSPQRDSYVLEGFTFLDDPGMENLPVDVLVGLVQSWEGLEASLTAAAALACVSLLADSDAELAQRASGLLLASPTFGHMCEALFRAGAEGTAVGLPETAAGDSGAGPGSGLYSGTMGTETATAPHAMPCPSLARVCAVLSQFLSHTLSHPKSAGLLLCQAVADHAVGWLLHASLLPLQLRRQLLRQLLGTEGHAAISAAAAQAVDAPLALCHIISAPSACHSLLTPDVAGYLLTAVSFGLVALQSSPQAKPQQDAAFDGSAAAMIIDARLSDQHHQEVQEQEMNNQELVAAGGDAGWEPDAALLGAQALGGPQDQDDENFIHEGFMDVDRDDVWDAAIAAPGGVAVGVAALPGAVADAGAAGTAGAGAERPVSTLAVACRLLLACNRLDNAFGAFLSDLRVAGRAVLNRRLHRNDSGPASLGYARRGSLDGRLRELNSSVMHQTMMAALRGSNGSSSGGGGGGFGAYSAMAEGFPPSLPSPSGSSCISRACAPGWGLLPMSGKNGGGGGGGGAGAGASAGSSYLEGPRTSCEAGVGRAHGLHGAGVTALSSEAASGGSHSDLSLRSVTSATSVTAEAAAAATERSCSAAAYAYGRSASGFESRTEVSGGVGNSIGGGGDGDGDSGGGVGSCNGKVCHAAAAFSSPRWLQPPVGVLTDVMAGVAGLIEAMLWRSPSLGGGCCLRGGFGDTYDSMSESDLTTMASQLSHDRFRTDDGEVHSFAAAPAIPLPSMHGTAPRHDGSLPAVGRTHEPSAADMGPYGTGSLDGGGGKVASFADWQVGMDSGSRLCSQSGLVQRQWCSIAAAVRRMRRVNSSSSDRGCAALSSLSNCLTQAEAGQVLNEQQMDDYRYQQQRQGVQDSGEYGDCTHWDSVQGPASIATWLRPPSPADNPEFHHGPSVESSYTASNPKGSALPSWRSAMPYRSASVPGLLEAGTGWSGSSMIPVPCLSNDEICQVAAATANGAKDGTPQVLASGAWGPESSGDVVLVHPDTASSGASGPQHPVAALSTSRDGLMPYGMPRSSFQQLPLGVSGGSEASSEGVGSGGFKPSHPFEQDRTSVGSSVGNLPPYTYFGSPQLTAAALALPVDVATMVTTMLSTSGSSFNSAASRIAIAAAAAAAAAAETVSNAGATEATTAATTLAASAANTKPLACEATSTDAASPSDTAGEGHWSVHLHNISVFRTDFGHESDTHFAADVGAASNTNTDGAGNYSEFSFGGRDSTGNSHISQARPNTQRSDGYGYGFFPGFPDGLGWTWRGRAGADASASPPPASVAVARHGVEGLGGAGSLEPSPSDYCRALAAPEDDPTKYSERAPAAALWPGSTTCPYPAPPPIPISSRASVQELTLASGESAGNGVLDISSETANQSPWFAGQSSGARYAEACMRVGGRWVEETWNRPTVADATRSADLCAQQPGPIPNPSHASLVLDAAPPAAGRAAVPLIGLNCSLEDITEEKAAVFMFGNERVEVATRAFRTLRRSSPLLYSWLSRVPDLTRPITILQIPGLDNSTNRRVFLQLLAWVQGVGDVQQLLIPQQGPLHQQQQEQQPSRPASPQQQQDIFALRCGDAISPATAPAVALEPSAAPDTPTSDSWRPQGSARFASPDVGGAEPLEQLWQLWRAADYLQVDELLTAVEDELARRFTLPPPHGPAAWTAALSLAGSQQHFLGAASRLAQLCALHFMRRVWGVLGDEELLIAAGGGAAILGPAVAAEVRDRLVALVALADLDLSSGE